MSDDSRTRLRNELLNGADSKPTKPADSKYFAHLRNQVRHSRPTPKPAVDL